MKKKLIIRQEEISDCGACSLLSIIRYYNGNANLESIRIESLTTSSGVTAYNLIECAKKYGFDAIGIKNKIIKKENLPCIAHLNINKSLSHFVVVYNIDEDNVTLMDPAVGKRIVSIKEFYTLFTGNMILLYPKEVINHHPKKIIHTKLKKTFLDHYSIFIKILFFNLLFIILAIFNTFYIKILSNTNNMLKVIVFFFIIAMIKEILFFIINKKSINLNYLISKSIIPDFFNHIFRLPLKYIHMKNPGEILKRVDDLEMVKNITTETIVTLFLNGFIITPILIVIYHYNKLIFLILLIMFIVYILLSLIINKRINEPINEMIEASTKYNSKVIDSLCGLTSIYHLALKEHYLKDVTNTLEDKLKTNKKFEIASLKKATIKNIIVSVFETLINTVLIIQVINNYIDMEMVLIINFMTGIYLSSLNEIYSIIPSYIIQKNIITRINEFYEIDEENNEGIELINGDILINNLKFSYNKFNPVLNNFNVLIKRGDKVIIKGQSGCGKSTLCRLINKEYLNYEGSIIINNQNLKDVSLSSIRSNIAYSSQIERIFCGTIKDNILMGQIVDEKKLKTIIDICQLHVILDKKPFGLDTFLYGGGEELSGGERQLIILARTLIRNCNIIILDETMSEVSEDLEDKILKSMFKYYKDKTIIYVTHKNNKKYFQREIHV